MHDVAVTAFTDAKITAPMKGAAPRFDNPSTEITPADMLKCARRSLLHAEIDSLADTVAVAREQSAHRTNRAVIGRRMIRLKAHRTHRLPARKAVHVEHSAERRQNRIVRLVAAIGAGLPKGRERKHD